MEDAIIRQIGERIKRTSKKIDRENSLPQKLSEARWSDWTNAGRQGGIQFCSYSSTVKNY
jgi:hypothetical protein